eukprot:COSAG02_NODE_11750_length_1662_cov_1.015355_2_plen_44_part_01
MESPIEFVTVTWKDDGSTSELVDMASLQAVENAEIELSTEAMLV